MIKKRKLFAVKALAVVLSVCAVCSVYGNGTEMYDFRSESQSNSEGASQDARTVDLGETGRIVTIAKYLALLNGDKIAADVLGNIGLGITIADDVQKIKNAKTEEERIKEQCRFLLHVSTTVLGTVLNKTTKSSLGDVIGDLISDLGDHGLDHPEDNGFAILVNWFYDNSSIPEKITEWYYDVRYGDADTRIKRLGELAILISDSNPQTRIFTPLLKEIMEKLESLRKSDLKRVAPGPKTPFDEILDPPGPDNPVPNNSTGRFQGLKPIKLL